MSFPAIVRIKRKRTEEPHDALVIATKKAKVGGEVFKYAETVEEKKFFDDVRKAKDLQNRIASLSRAPPPVSPAQPSPAQSHPPLQKSIPDDNGKAYTIVNTSTTPATPPDEASQAPSIALPKEADFQMYDAVLETAPAPPSPTQDAELAAFLPMLQEYLRLNDTPASILPPTGGSAPAEEDYVWDVYYLTSSEWANLGNVATVNGVPPWILEGAMIDDDSETDSVRDDEDEDSNAEDFYQNDYPDEDFRFSSDDDDDDDSEEEYFDDEQHDWR